jgi:hypothetical protein
MKTSIALLLSNVSFLFTINSYAQLDQLIGMQSASAMFQGSSGVSDVNTQEQVNAGITHSLPMINYS